jgi:ketosteroid isomerase-like protein
LTEQAGDRANVAVVQRFYEGYAGQDMEKIREVLAEDVTWLIPGHHPLAGLKRGADEIVAFFNQLANEDWVVDVHRGWGEYGEATLDMNWVLAYRIRDGKIAEVQNFAADQHAADLFFWRVWGNSLKPLPDRLADA